MRDEQLPIHPTRKWLRILVQKQGEKPVNIRVPLGLMNFGMRLLGESGLKIGSVPISTQEFWDSLQSETAGTILEVEGEDGEHVEMVIE
jgi:hypothetical protein